MRSDKADEENEPWLYRKAAELGDWWRRRHPPEKPSIDRKHVRDRYQEAIWPVLREHGFNDFADGGAWRHAEKRTDVVYLQFFPRLKTLQWGLTPFSFTVESGIFLPFVPPRWSQLNTTKSANRPKEFHFQRKPVSRHLKQPKNRIPNIWYVAPDGGNLDDVLQDVRQSLVEEVLPWFKALEDLRYVLRTLTEEERGDLKLDLTLGVSSYIPGFLALELGNWQLAADSLQKAIDSGAYSAAKFAAYSPSGGNPRYRSEEDRYKAKRIKRIEALEGQIRAALERARTELAKRGRTE